MFGRSDPVLPEDPDQPSVVEVVHRQAEVADAGLHVGPAAAQGEELRSVADAHDQRPRLARRDRHPEQPLVELAGSADVRDVGVRDL